MSGKKTIQLIPKEFLYTSFHLVFYNTILEEHFYIKENALHSFASLFERAKRKAKELNEEFKDEGKECICFLGFKLGEKTFFINE